MRCDDYDSCGDASDMCLLGPAGVAGVVIASVILIVFLAAVIAALLYRRHRRRRQEKVSGWKTKQKQKQETRTKQKLTFFKVQSKTICCPEWDAILSLLLPIHSKLVGLTDYMVMWWVGVERLTRQNRVQSRFFLNISMKSDLTTIWLVKDLIPGSLSCSYKLLKLSLVLTQKDFSFCGLQGYIIIINHERHFFFI